MKNHYEQNLSFLISFGIMFIAFFGNAQTPQYSNSTISTGGNSIPLSWNSAGARGDLLFPVGDFGTVPNGKYISTIYMACGSSGTGTALYDFLEISLKQDNVTALNSGSWTTGMVTVLSTTSYSINNTIGQWFAIELETPFP